MDSKGQAEKIIIQLVAILTDGIEQPKNHILMMKNGLN